jgi:hypothetical protein
VFGSAGDKKEAFEFSDAMADGSIASKLSYLLLLH